MAIPNIPKTTKLQHIPFHRHTNEFVRHLIPFRNFYTWFSLVLYKQLATKVSQPNRIVVESTSILPRNLLHYEFFVLRKSDLNDSFSSVGSENINYRITNC